MWLDSRSNKSFNKEFKSCAEDQQKSLLDEIAYPDKATAEVEQGARFFSLMRDLTLVEYYTAQMEIKTLATKAILNVWDGVPDDVLKQHRMRYEDEWLMKCMDPKTHNEVAKWDYEGNLIS